MAISPAIRRQAEQQSEDEGKVLAALDVLATQEPYRAAKWVSRSKLGERADMHKDKRDRIIGRLVAASVLEERDDVELPQGRRMAPTKCVRRLNRSADAHPDLFAA